MSKSKPAPKKEPKAKAGKPAPPEPTLAEQIESLFGTVVTAYEAVEMQIAQGVLLGPIKGKITGWRRKLAELLAARFQPQIPGIESPPPPPGLPPAIRVDIALPAAPGQIPLATVYLDGARYTQAEVTYIDPPKLPPEPPNLHPVMPPGPAGSPAPEELVRNPTPVPPADVAAPPQSSLPGELDTIPPVELQVDIDGDTPEAIAALTAQIEAGLGRKAVEAQQPDDDNEFATLYFEYDTLADAQLDEGVLVGIDNVKATAVTDPAEARFSAEELARIDAAPRSLRATPDGQGIYCTRCVAVGRSPVGVALVPAAPPADLSCFHCAWPEGVAP